MCSKINKMLMIDLKKKRKNVNDRATHNIKGHESPGAETENLS